MALQIGDFLLVPEHETEHLRTYDDLRRFLESHLGDDLTGIENRLKELGHANVIAVRMRFSPPRGIGKSPQIGVPLRELARGWVPEPARPIPTSAPAVEPEPWFEAKLVTDDGVPIPDVQLEIRDGWGFEATVTTDGDGHFRVNTKLEGPHEIKVKSPPIKLPEPPTEARKVDGYALPRDSAESMKLNSNKAHTLIVQRPRATVVSLDGWWENQKVMIFQSARDTDFGPVTVRGILRQALCSPKGGEIHVVGHADTKGGGADNDSLAMTRAQSVFLYLSGKREEWAQHAFANADVATLQAALYWISINSVIDCDPGPVDGDWGPASSFGLTMLRMEHGISPAAPLGPDDWAVIYDRFDEGLATIMLTDKAGLDAARARVQAIDPTSKGERFPVEAPNLNDHESPANRRVDVVFCHPGAIPAPDSDEVYDGTFSLDYLAVTPECKVQIFATNPKLEPLPLARVLLQVGPLGQRWLNTDITATVMFTALRGDKMRIIRATEPGGSGRMVNTGLQEAVIQAEQAIGELA